MLLSLQVSTQRQSQDLRVTWVEMGSQIGESCGNRESCWRNVYIKRYDRAIMGCQKICQVMCWGKDFSLLSFSSLDPSVTSFKILRSQSRPTDNRGLTIVYILLSQTAQCHHMPSCHHQCSTLEKRIYRSRHNESLPLYFLFTRNGMSCRSQSSLNPVFFHSDDADDEW